MEFSTQGAYLEVKAGAETTYKKCYGLYKLPAVGGSREKIDVTNLDDTHKRSIDGIMDYGSLEFDFYDTKDEEDTTVLIKQTYSTFRTWELANTTVDFRMVYPDNTGFKWSGTVSTQKEEASVNSAMKFKVFTSISSELEDYEIE